MIEVEKGWQSLIEEAYAALDGDYRAFLEKNSGYFPNYDNFLNAFKTLPFSNTKAILFGQDPYPRQKSAIGYAFIDGGVENLFCRSGLSREVNRATSLRNFIKMLFLAQAILDAENLTQDNIAKLDKTKLISTIKELRENFEKQGVLLLNTALVFEDKKRSSYHIKAFEPFMRRLLELLSNEQITLILFGNFAANIKKLLPKEHNFTLVQTPHPYNISFITHKNALELFGKMNLLSKNKG